MSKNLGKQELVLQAGDLKKIMPRALRRHKWELGHSGISTKEQIHRSLKHRAPRHKPSPLDDLE